MLFGDLNSFAVEAISEPGPELPRFVGRSLAGRFRILIKGKSFGNFDEPCCVFGPLTKHLTSLCSTAEALWHPTLEDLTDESLFDRLDRFFFIGAAESIPKQLALTNFLTNVSEALNVCKGFLVSPAPGPLKALIRRTSEATRQNVNQLKPEA